MLKPNVPAWFEIPARDLDRAQAFYQTLLGVALKRERFSEDIDQAIFPAGEKPNAAGALVRWDEVYAPSAPAALGFSPVRWCAGTRCMRPPKVAVRSSTSTSTTSVRCCGAHRNSVARSCCR